MRARRISATAELKEPRSAGERRVLGVAGDPAALGPLYDRYAKRVYGRALAILGSPEEAEDLTQDVFLILCGPTTAYDPQRGSLSAFLAAMARSRAIDRLRGRHRSARLLRSWPETATPAPADGMPSEHVATRRTAERVRAALSELPPSQREVLELAYYRGLSQREIAAALDTPLGTVKSWSRRALQTLGDALEDLVA